MSDEKWKCYQVAMGGFQQLVVDEGMKLKIFNMNKMSELRRTRGMLDNFFNHIEGDVRDGISVKRINGIISLVWKKGVIAQIVEE